MENIEEKIDLHIHSTFSDGELQPEQIGAAAERENEMGEYYCTACELG